MHQRSPTVLIILDGFGYNEKLAHNAIANANTPQWDNWWKNYPHITLDASGEAVGLPNGQMGNSEVGHMHIGAGRVILQNYTQINTAIQNNDFDNNPVFIDAIKKMQKNNHAIHVMGLLSAGGVHSHENHLFAFLRLCAKYNFNKIYLHLFLDGRDVPPKSAKNNISSLNQVLKETNNAIISTISGRYYAMDRDKRWSRIAKVYNLLVDGESEYSYSSAEAAIDDFYKQNIFDEFIPPTKIGKSPSIQNGDTIFFFNFRADRARQLTRAFIENNFTEFPRKTTLTSLNFISMTKYEENLATKVAFPKPQLNNTLGEIIAKNDLKQLRIAETEKYAHVTFFLNGGVEVKFAKEDRLLVPSPKITTYDLQPEMSANLITDKIIEAIDKQAYDVIICNYANADMVGHSGMFKATIAAIEAIDKSLERIGKKILEVNGQLLITADHGNAESMFDEKTNQPHTAHTTLPVPLLYVGKEQRKFKQVKASLCDVAPTFLALLGIKPPSEMTGQILWSTK